MQAQSPSPEPMPLHWYPAVLQSTCPLCWKQYHPCKFIRRLRVQLVVSRQGKWPPTKAWRLPFFASFQQQSLQVSLQPASLFFQCLLRRRRTKQFHIPPDYSGVTTLAGRRRSRFHHMPGLTHEFFDRIRHQLLLAQLTPSVCSSHIQRIAHVQQWRLVMTATFQKHWLYLSSQPRFPSLWMR